jgi:hypothetical protein
VAQLVRTTAIVSLHKNRYKLRMTFTRIPLLILMTSLASIVAGCSGGAPYVFDPDEFNRESDIYRKGILDREEVTVCYSKRATTPRQIATIARNECAKFGKTAQFNGQSYSKCPLLTPIAANYECVQQNTNTLSSGFN